MGAVEQFHRLKVFLNFIIEHRLDIDFIQLGDSDDELMYVVTLEDNSSHSFTIIDKDVPTEVLQAFANTDKDTVTFTDERENYVKLVKKVVYDIFLKAGVI